jgi:hypothetical protein
MVNLISDLFLNWRSPAMGKATSESGIVAIEMQNIAFKALQASKMVPTRADRRHIMVLYSLCIQKIEFY